MKLPLKSLLVATVIAGFSSSVHAVPMLELYDFDTGISLTIADGSALDAFSQDGVIGYVGSIAGTTWSINLVGGLSDGTAGDPHLHLNVMTSSSGAGTLGVSFLVDGLGPTSANVISAVGGVGAPGGDLSFLTAASTTNATDFSADEFLIFQGAYVGAFSGTNSTAVSLDGPYSLLLTGYIEHTGAGTSSFDQDVSVPDGGTTVLLIGLGLVGMGLVARRFKFAAA